MGDGVAAFLLAVVLVGILWLAVYLLAKAARARQEVFVAELLRTDR